MIRSIAYELFDRLTTDPDALRKRLADANYALESLRDTKLFSEELMAECDALQLQVRELKLQLESSPTTIEHTKQAAALANAQLAIAAHEANNRRLQERVADAQRQHENQLRRNDTLESERAKDVAQLRSEISTAHAEIARLQKAYANFAGTDLTIEPTWILALWSIHAEGWTEDKRGSYDSMLTEIRKYSTAWQLFPRSAWDALVKNGRAR
jgi:multidrug resistance efflux pump